MSNHHHLENPHPAGNPAGGSSAYPSQPIPQNLSWRAPSLPYPAGFPASANPEPNYVSGPLFVAPENATALYPWRMHSDDLKQVARNLTLQVDSEVVGLQKEKCGPNRLRVTVVFEMPDEI